MRVVRTGDAGFSGRICVNCAHGRLASFALSTHTDRGCTAGWPGRDDSYPPGWELRSLIYGDGGQTRSFGYLDDLVRGGIAAMIDSDCSESVKVIRSSLDKRPS